jgi:glycosyltransferase involved in cell wall biosynthesis
MKTSIVIRTYNEQRHLADVLEAVGRQKTNGLSYEVIIVDSGSTDNTLPIAREYGCRILHITKEVFTFGRSLNIGCDAASGSVLVFISGHCVPANNEWLENLLAPLVNGDIAYSYGRQIGGNGSKFSECQLFNKYYPANSQIPQEGFFCNNANAGLLKSTWEKFKFAEDLTGLEDMHLAKQLVSSGLTIGYVANAPVCHLHHETWKQIRLRFEREAIALQRIMPEIHLTMTDFIRYLMSAITLDSSNAIQQKKLLKTFPEIVLYRTLQFWGSYRGNQYHRILSNARKERYFYPK